MNITAILIKAFDEVSSRMTRGSKNIIIYILLALTPINFFEGTSLGY
jgi:hypothetical protein